MSAYLGTIDARSTGEDWGVGREMYISPSLGGQET
jgi:hypothetical protein